MKKKICVLCIGVALACLMTGCGEKKAANKVAGATSSVGKEVAAEMKTAVDEFNSVSEVKESEEVANEEVNEEAEVVEPETVEETEEFPAIGVDALGQDNSEAYGVNSISCYDLEQYLDEDGTLPGYDDYNSTIYTEYSGRWAYPKFTPCRFFEDLTIVSRVDNEEFLRSVDSETGTNMSTFVYSGLSTYKAMYDAVSTSDDYNIMFTTETVDGGTDVVYNESHGTITIDGGETIELNSYNYTFSIAEFSVMVITDMQLTEDEVQTIIDNIRPTNGLER